MPAKRLHRPEVCHSARGERLLEGVLDGALEVGLGEGVVVSPLLVLEALNQLYSSACQDAMRRWAWPASLSQWSLSGQETKWYGSSVIVPAIEFS